ncbi:glycosyltransferase family 2 protein [Candidatus Endoriftia persephone]|nr:glycosyltransferase family 2 protein [Candidatus Endoriftia persephone]
MSGRIVESDGMGVPPVSLIIVNHDAGPMLADCIASSLDQAEEIIVVDNASSDNSLALLEARFPAESHIHLIRNRTNLGFAAACNIGLERARGDYLMFLNPDCLLELGCVARLVSAHKSYTDTGMVGGLLLNPSGTEQGGGRRAVPTPWRSFVRAFGLYSLSHRWPRLFFDFHLHEQPLPEQPIEVEAISGACMLVSRNALEDVGPLDAGYFLHCEDLDWCMRFRRKGWKILFVPDAKIIHYRGVCGLGKPIFVAWHKHRGMIRFYRKFFKHQYPGVLMWLVGLGVWLRFGATALYHLLHSASCKVGKRRG